MVRLSRPLKGLVLAGALGAGLLPSVAQAKWIKATVTGSVASYSDAVTPFDNLSVSTDITFNFYIQNYSGTSFSPNYWEQLTTKPNYSQLFGYGTGTNSTGIVGTFNAVSIPGGGGNTIELNNNGTQFLMRVSGTPSSGLSVARGAVLTNIENVSLAGNLDSFSSSFPTSTDVVDFLSASLGDHSCTTTSAPYNCKGKIQTSGEGAITFSWTKINFSQIEAVPAPLPLTGALAAFRLSRAIRRRVKLN